MYSIRDAACTPNIAAFSGCWVYGMAMVSDDSNNDDGGGGGGGGGGSGDSLLMAYALEKNQTCNITSK